MKKLFISCPMKGRTEENIRKTMYKMHKIAEIVFDQELEVIPSYIKNDNPISTDRSIWLLGQSIQLLSQADYFIGIDYTAGLYKGCDIEGEVAAVYGIPSINMKLRDITPDCCPKTKPAYI